MLTADLSEVVFKVLLTVVLSGVIGFEREFRQKVAGLRTHILVGVGSTLIVLTSFHLFEVYRTIAVIDPTRIISNIVTGIGFLCAGAIIRAGSQVTGLTSAATLWVVSGIGIAVGSGDYVSAIVVSVVVFIVLVWVRAVEYKLVQKFKNHKTEKP